MSIFQAQRRGPGLAVSRPPLETALADCRADCDAVLFILTLGADGSRVFLGDLEMTAAAPKLKTLLIRWAPAIPMASILCWVLEHDLATRDALGAVGEDALTNATRRAAEAAAINCRRSGCTRHGVMS